MKLDIMIYERPLLKSRSKLVIFRILLSRRTVHTGDYRQLDLGLDQFGLLLP